MSTYMVSFTSGCGSKAEDAHERADNTPRGNRGGVHTTRQESTFVIISPGPGGVAARSDDSAGEVDRLSLLARVPDIPHASDWRLTIEDIQPAAAPTSDTSPGTDDVPYALWRNEAWASRPLVCEAVMAGAGEGDHAAFGASLSNLIPFEGDFCCAGPAACLRQH